MKTIQGHLGTIVPCMEYQLECFHPSSFVATAVVFWERKATNHRRYHRPLPPLSPELFVLLKSFIFVNIDCANHVYFFCKIV